MFEHQKILNQIEKLVERLPYKSVKIEIEVGEQILILEKQKHSKLDFFKIWRQLWDIVIITQTQAIAVWETVPCGRSARQPARNGTKYTARYLHTGWLQKICQALTMYGEGTCGSWASTVT